MNSSLLTVVWNLRVPVCKAGRYKFDPCIIIPIPFPLPVCRLGLLRTHPVREKVH